MEVALSVIILCSAAVTIVASLTGRRRLQYCAKPLTTLLILVLALVLTLANPPWYRTLIVLGLLFSLVGDILLMLPRDLFIYGLASFLATHLCYLAAFSPGSQLAPLWLLPLLAILVTLSLVLWSRLRGLRLPVLLYECVIVAMVWRGLARMSTLGSTAAILAAVGALFFLLSDSLLALDRFRARFRLAPLFVLGTYYLAQWLIALSV